MTSHSLNALPIELLVFVIENLDQARDISALAQTNRRLYSTANPLLYQQAAQSNDARPLAWAARHGLVSTLKFALGAGLDPNHEFVEHIPADEWKKAIAATRDGSVLTTSDQESVVSTDGSLPQPGHVLPAREPLPRHPPDMVTRRFYAIHLAASPGRDEIIKILLEHGASFNVSAERLCTCTQQYGLLNSLENPRNDLTPSTWSPLHIAICHSHSQTAKLLLSRGAPHIMEYWNDATDWLSGYINPDLTALHHAAAMGLTDLVRYLVESGIQKDVNLPDPRTFTPFYHAYANRRWDSTVPLLLELGANIDVETKMYIPYTAITPLGEACRLGHYEVADRLIDLGANAKHGFVATNGGTMGGCLTPLHMCCMRSATAPDAPKNPGEEEEWRGAARMKTIEKLIAKGAKLEVKDCFGSTPMMAATQWGNGPAINALLKAGAELHDPNVTGRAALP
jgi:ankyrin repeat protein